MNRQKRRLERPQKSTASRLAVQIEVPTLTSALHAYDQDVLRYLGTISSEVAGIQSYEALDAETYFV